MFRTETAANPRPNRAKRRRQLTRGQARGRSDDLFLQPFCRSGERSFAVGGRNEFVQSPLNFAISSNPSPQRSGRTCAVRPLACFSPALRPQAISRLLALQCGASSRCS